MHGAAFHVMLERAVVLNFCKAACLGIALICCAVSGAALGQPSPNASGVALELSDRQKEIIRTVRAADGYIDENLHEEFWSQMPSAFRASPALRIQLDDLLLDVGDARQSFLEQSWRSVGESLKYRRIVRTKAYLDAKQAVLKASTNPAYQEKVRESIASAERLLDAAANGTPIDVSEGRTFITNDMIEHILSGIRASEYRYSKLLLPTWDDQLEVFSYPEGHISVLALTPFTLERKVIQSEAGAINLVSLSQTVNSRTHTGISYAALRGRYSDPVKSLLSNARAAIGGLGASGRHPYFEKWRGLNSATASGVAQTSEGNFHLTVRVVEVPEINGLLQFIAVSQLSGAEALAQRWALENSSRILP